MDFRGQDREGVGRGAASLWMSARRDPRGRGRVGLRQVDARHRPDGAPREQRAGSGNALSRAGTCCDGRAAHDSAATASRWSSSDPTSALDPCVSIGDQIAEIVPVHQNTGGRLRRAALALLEDVGIPAAEQRYDDPPHRLSGGMRQRVVVAAALANDPALLIADEPSTALDVTIQARVRPCCAAARRRGTAILLITHDLGVVAQLCDRVAVMYAGQLVEVAPVEDSSRAAPPVHPRAARGPAERPPQPGGSLRTTGQVPTSPARPAAGSRRAARWGWTCAPTCRRSRAPAAATTSRAGTSSVRRAGAVRRSRRVSASSRSGTWSRTSQSAASGSAADSSCAGRRLPAHRRG